MTRLQEKMLVEASALVTRLFAYHDSYYCNYIITVLVMHFCGLFVALSQYEMHNEQLWPVFHV